MLLRTHAEVHRFIRNNPDARLKTWNRSGQVKILSADEVRKHLASMTPYYMRVTNRVFEPIEEKQDGES